MAPRVGDNHRRGRPGPTLPHMAGLRVAPFRYINGLAISFLETPLKFRAPGVTVPIGLGIGRLVFRALNAAEVVLGLNVVVAMASGGHRRAAEILSVMALTALAVRLTLVRPQLRRRTERVLAADRSSVPPLTSCTWHWNSSKHPPCSPPVCWCSQADSSMKSWVDVGTVRR